MFQIKWDNEENPSEIQNGIERLGMNNQTVKVRNLEIGRGRPKIMASIVGKTQDEVLEQAKMMVSCPVDIVEWRLDWFEGSCDTCLCSNLSQEIRAAIGGAPLLMTFRTKDEGGERKLNGRDYEDFYTALIDQSCADLIDAELFKGNEIFSRLVEKAHSKNIKVIGSSHDFEKTPEKAQIIARLCKMQDLGADILKISVMPQNRSDVIALMDATRQMYEEYATQPLITISMGPLGLASRLVGETYGSAATFGAAAAASAPGQISVDDLETVLTIVHKGI